MRTNLFISAVFLLLTEACYAQWSKQDSLKLQKLLRSNEELKLNPEAVRSIDLGNAVRTPRMSEEKNWMLPDESLPKILPEPKVVLTLMPYTANTRYNWDPIYQKKIIVDHKTWQKDSFSHLYAENKFIPQSVRLGNSISANGILQRGVDFVSSSVAVRCYAAVGVGIQGLDLMKVFTKDFWDVKGKARRKRTFEALKTYGDSTAVGMNQPIFMQE